MRKELTAMAISTMLVGGTVICHATSGPGDPAGPGGLVGPGAPGPGCQEVFFPPPFPDHLARILELTDAQKVQIKAFFAEEREKATTQQKKASELRQQLRQAEQAASFNEAAVRSAAAALAGIETERIVSRAKTRFRIQSVLMPAQRTLAEKLRPEPGDLSPPQRRCCDEHEGRHPRRPEELPDWR